MKNEKAVQENKILISYFPLVYDDVMNQVVAQLQYVLVIERSN